MVRLLFEEIDAFSDLELRLLSSATLCDALIVKMQVRAHIADHQASAWVKPRMTAKLQSPYLPELPARTKRYASI